ncbi:uncharacterized protein MELLADRAFT_94861 [Melampsora larici-populina 98AG31]|uniref:Uncharacterized protein n=1 Tax=Melampsora larici-populina (strain 98AG31 / pathotype 3-4-7) TaxID=747676 RepID=F4S870_MELLP|nr:uncharacterized protein MELLADRAFT_94861 [Melampsora larici-populina 98AG31]EGF99168.1 hypothetical protein MELLADRAFT_94861 [Melampsora larici-populina 98AG31]
MLMDHTASGHVIPQLDMASSARKTELAGPEYSGSTGVVYPLTTQGINQKLEYAAQMKAQAEQEYGTLSGTTHNDRNLQAWTWTYAPPGSEDPLTVPSSSQSTVPSSSQSDDSSDNHVFKYIIGGGLVVIAGCAAAALCCLRDQFKCPKREVKADIENHK